MKQDQKSPQTKNSMKSASSPIVRDVMRAKEPRHRPSRKNKSCQTKSPTAIAPAQAQVPPGKHCADHQHRKQQNNENHQNPPVRRRSADTAACVRDGSKGQSTRSRRACPGMPQPQSASGYRGARPAILSTQRARRYKQEASTSAAMAATWTDRAPRQRTAAPSQATTRHLPASQPAEELR